MSKTNKYRREYLTFIHMGELLSENYNKVSKRRVQYFSAEQIGARLERCALNWIGGNNPYEKFLYREGGDGFLIYGLRLLEGKSRKETKKEKVLLDPAGWFSF